MRRLLFDFGMGRYPGRQFFLSLVFFASLMVLSFVLLETPLRDALSSLNQYLRTEPFAQLIIVVVLVALLAFDVILPVPSSVVALTAVAWLGAAVGGAVIFMGLCLGCILGYALGAGWCRTWGLEPAHRDYQRARDFSGLSLGLALLALRPVPILAELSVLAAGISHFSLRRFLMLTSVANLIVALVYVFLALALVKSL